MILAYLGCTSHSQFALPISCVNEHSLEQTCARTAWFHVSPVLQWTGKGPCEINESQARCEDEHSPKLAMIAPSLVHANPMINHECIQFSYRELIFQDWHSLLGEWVPTPSAATCCNLLAQKWGARLNSKNSKGVTRIPWRKVPKERSKLIWNISNNVLAYPTFPKLMFRS